MSTRPAMMPRAEPGQWSAFLTDAQLERVARLVLERIGVFPTEEAVEEVRRALRETYDRGRMRGNFEAGQE